MNTPISLVLVAHGSRSPVATEQIEQFTAQLGGRLAGVYQCCKPAFLEMASPSIDDCIIDLHKQGINHIHVLPYFLSDGVHVTKDIPAVIDSLSERFPEMTFEVLPAVGLASQMLDVVDSIVHEAFATHQHVLKLDQTA